MTYLINYAIAPYSMKIFDELLNYWWIEKLWLLFDFVRQKS